MSHGACQVGVSGHEPAFTSAGTFQIAQTVDIAFCVDEVPQARTVCLASAVVAAGLSAPPVLIPGTTQRTGEVMVLNSASDPKIGIAGRIFGST
jgi:hypothetical protein